MESRRVGADRDGEGDRLMANRLLEAALDRLEEYTGYSVVDSEHLRVQEAAAREAYVLANDLEELGYTALNYAQGRPSEPNANTRRRWAQQARVVWLADPMAGASTEMLNEFTFGRGVPRPHSKHKQVQESMDEFWDNPQNQRVLTSFVAQMRFGTSLSIQSNVWFLMFDDGDDGEVVLSFLNHDTVETAYTDPENRQRVLFWVARKIEDEWDFRTHGAKPQTRLPKLFYYEAWGNLQEALVERGMDTDDAKDLLDRYRAAGDTETEQDPEAGDPINPGEPFDTGVGLMFPPPQMLGQGKVYHVGENFDMEMVFGVPRMRRTIRWYTAYNDFMAARVNMMQAAASFIGKKTFKGATGPGSLERLAQRASRASSDLRSVVDKATGNEMTPAPAPGSFMQTAGGADFEPLNLNSGAGNAETDAQMLRAQVSAGDRFPQHYLGDVGSANLATATSMELPVLKHVEARQELVEGVFRWGLDRKIERAIELHLIDPTAEEPGDDTAEDMPQVVRSIDEDAEVQEGAVVIAEALDMIWRVNRQDVIRPTRVVQYADGVVGYELLGVAEALEDEQDKAEAESGEDVDMDAFTTYEFALASPLRRMMGDVVNAASLAAQFADPNGENTQLTKILLTWVFSEGFEMQDAAGLVEEAFPKGYVPLSVQAMKQQLDAGVAPPQPAGQQPDDGSGDGGGNFFSPDATSMPADPGNAYGAKKRATNPEDVPVQEAADTLMTAMLRRDGTPMVLTSPHRRSAFLDNGKAARSSELNVMFDREMRDDTIGALADLDMGRPTPNGNGGTK